MERIIKYMKIGFYFICFVGSLILIFKILSKKERNKSVEKLKKDFRKKVKKLNDRKVKPDEFKNKTRADNVSAIRRMLKRWKSKFKR